MCNVSLLMKSIVFVDDTNLFYSGDDLTETCNTVSEELDKLCSWFQANNLHLNIAKINVMIISKKSLMVIIWSV